MSSRTLQQSLLRTTRRGSPALPSTGRPSFGLSLSVTSSPPATTWNEATTVQTRAFHQTPSRRLFESPDALVAAASLGVASGILLFKIVPRIRSIFSKSRGSSTVSPSYAAMPPHSWLFACDQNKRREVVEIIAAGFEMARKTPKSRRDQALREASFQVPHELARLDPEARQFRLEDTGPVPSAPEFSGLYKRPFDITKDARVFFYFPNGAKQATATFVAINAEFEFFVDPKPSTDGSAVEFKAKRENMDMVHAAMLACVIQHHNLKSKNPGLYGRIPPGQLPVIVNFRDKAAGSFYDTEAKGFHDVGSFMLMTRLREIPK